MNQPEAAERNFHMFWTALRTLLMSHESNIQENLAQLDDIRNGFAQVMQAEMEKMWAAKLGLGTFHADIFNELEALMLQTPIDYTIFFRELSNIPEEITPLKKSFYKSSSYDKNLDVMDKRWSEWFTKWTSLIGTVDMEALSRKMKLVNPKYSLREWFLVPAYKQANLGNYALVRELQEVMTQPYAEQSKVVEDKYYRLKPPEFFETGGLSHYSCSS